MKVRIAFFTLLLLAQAASAHPGHEVASNAIAGLLHPLTGLDHLIALICLGALLATATVRVRWMGVAALLAGLVAGAVVSFAGGVLPASEWVIGLSVLASGLMLVWSRGVRAVPLIGGVALFAVFHGFAHMAESGEGGLAFIAGVIAMSLTVVGLSMLARTLLGSQNGRGAVTQRSTSS
jgi:urease accessory protein